ncbi:Mitochondrial inner membrane protein oxa1l [Actinomortierella ambigua]|uniref:Mitochondrial inner membrane protein oxa1l n=1 Tax=Actinomortierella ambigua TaxID=1343610 RepID=A0A9P6PWX6_9FUNG|nr:Mitochondrial inner membrane protein oxa1l [Actinomortierella ambigua]
MLRSTLAAASRQASFPSNSTSYSARKAVPARTYGYLKTTAVSTSFNAQRWAAVSGSGLYRHMSTETTKAAFIEPATNASTLVSPIQTAKDASETATVAAATNTIDAPTAAQVASSVTEESVATATASTSSVIADAADTVALNADAIASTAMQYGDLKAMGLVNFSPVGFLETVLEAIHVSTALPWWATIAVTTVMIRTAMVPFMVKIQGNTARLHNVKPELDRLTENMRLAKESNDSQALARFSAETQELFKKHDCNPIKSLALPLIQAPVMISFYLALRDMAALPVPQFQDGGALWFKDLTIADPTYVLPVVSSLGFLAIMELGGEGGGVSQPKAVKNVMRFMAVAMVPLTMNFSSAIFVYWLTSNVFTAGQMMFFRNPAVRNYFKIPQLMKHSKKVAASAKKQPGFMESFKASYEGGLAAKQRELDLIKEREKKLAAQKLRKQSRKRL